MNTPRQPPKTIFLQTANIKPSCPDLRLILHIPMAFWFYEQLVSEPHCILDKLVSVLDIPPVEDRVLFLQTLDITRRLDSAEENDKVVCSRHLEKEMHRGASLQDVHAF